MARKRRLNGFAALNAAYGATDHGPLLAEIGVPISEDGLRLALTHRSFANEVSTDEEKVPTNERLEFVGDAVLGLIIGEELYRRFPEYTENNTTKARANVVNQYALAKMARTLNFGPYILLGRGESMTGGSDKDSILSDTFEAILGVLYVENGFAAAQGYVLRLFDQWIDEAPIDVEGLDPKTMLQETLAERGLPAAVYQVETEGPEHRLTFTATVHVSLEGEPPQFSAMGVGHNKREAEMTAARALLEVLRGDVDAQPAATSTADEQPGPDA